MYPKLTPEFFLHPECPTWAKYAAVDGDGRAFFFEEKPILGDHVWWNEIGTPLRRLFFVKFDKNNWQNSLIERNGNNQEWFKQQYKKDKMRKKLTQDVFIYRPIWAEWAAVDCNGSAYWYSHKPKRGKVGWDCPAGLGTLIAGVFDATDWKNSLIKRQKEMK